MDIILIPGLWLDGSSWDKVVAPLERAGHPARAHAARHGSRSTLTRSGSGCAICRTGRTSTRRTWAAWTPPRSRSSATARSVARPRDQRIRSACPASGATTCRPGHLHRVHQRDAPRVGRAGTGASAGTREDTRPGLRQPAHGALAAVHPPRISRGPLPEPVDRTAPGPPPPARGAARPGRRAIGRAWRAAPVAGAALLALTPRPARDAATSGYAGRPAGLRSCEPEHRDPLPGLGRRAARSVPGSGAFETDDTFAALGARLGTDHRVFRST